MHININIKWLRIISDFSCCNLTSLQNEMLALQKTQKELQDGSRKINEMMEEMEKKEVSGWNVWGGVWDVIRVVSVRVHCVIINNDLSPFTPLPLPPSLPPPSCSSLSLFPSLYTPPPPSFQREVDDGISTLQSKNTELESLLEYLRAHPNVINVDEAVMATTPIYEQ